MLTRLPIRLRFIEGEGGDGGAGEAPVVDQSQPTTEQPTQQPSGDQGGNPAWNDIRSQLDPISFSKIEPHLRSMDQAAQQRITSVNQQYAPFKQFSDAGIPPERLAQAIQYADMLDKDPVKVHEMLGGFLKETGRMPTAAEAEQAMEDQENDEDQEPQGDPRVDQILGFLQQQARQQAEQVADAELAQEVSSLQTTHAELTQEDVKDIIGRAALAAQQAGPNGKIPSLEEVYQGYFLPMRNRILTAPRPGDSAPQLLPTSGGTPQSGQQKKLGELSRSETQDLIASLVEANRGQ
jgi:hypothetical protein